VQRVVISVTNDIATDQRVNKVSCYLFKAGFDILIIGRKRQNSLPVNSIQFKTKRMKLLFNKGPFFYAEYNLRLLFVLLFLKTDILLANDLDTLPANYIISKILRKKLVYDSHEYFTEVPELNGRKLTKKIWLIIEKLILPEIKFSYTVSDSIANIYNEKYKINMKVIRNFPYYAKDSNDYLQNAIPENKKIIIYQGVLNIGRGIENVIEAMQFIEQAILLIVGDGDIKQDLENLVLKLNLSDKVIFLGRVPYDELPSITKKANIGVSLEQKISLSYYYSLPNKIFDYIYSGVPVLVSDMPEVKKIVGKYEIGVIVDNFDAKYLSRQINEMLENEIKINIWKNNLSIAAREFCWENEEIKLGEIFF
jgi:glycosyltransferase involved in cell wall biosynthesis